MSFKSRLFLHKNPYDTDETEHLFLSDVIENLKYHQSNCEKYSDILKSQEFDIGSISSIDDLHKIPPLPTLFFKRNKLFSVSQNKMAVKAHSSGTKGMQSQIGLDMKTMVYGVIMMIRFFSYHKVISLLPTNYIILSYKPKKDSNLGALKTAQGTTKFAPALHRKYAIKDGKKGLEIDSEGIVHALYKYEKQHLPVRFVGFPAYMYFLAKELKDRGISIKLNKHSKILMGGGWKQFANQEIDRDEFYALIKETLGIEKYNCYEFFSAVEHPLPYLKCTNGHFHIPIYSRVIIRDVNTLEPVEDGTAGLLSFVTPLVSSVPLTSVVTDDIAVKRSETCGCGIDAQYFDLLGRAGVSQIKTCTTEAADLIGRSGK